MDRSGPAFVDYQHYEVYGYNDRSELLTATYYTGTYPNGSHQTAKDHTYAYDPIGNRTSYRLGPEQDPTTTYCANGLNQYDTLDDDSSACPVQSPDETLDYDDDGNLTADGTYSYEWDAENRLSAVYKTSPSTSSDKKLVFAYDYLGRRIEKQVYAWVAGNPGSWSTTASLQRRFVWDGWKLLEELNGLSSNAVLRQYTWGLDLAGLMGGAGVSPANLESAGTIGGLLALHDQVGTARDYVYFYDENGNAGQVMNIADCMSAWAKYEYDPYGNLTASYESAWVSSPLTFRFSTKYLDTETGLYYFGYRYYLPRLGRWINRDPISEEGGVNLYGYVGNGPIDGVDPDGLWSTWSDSSYWSYRTANSLRREMVEDDKMTYTVQLEWQCNEANEAEVQNIRVSASNLEGHLDRIGYSWGLVGVGRIDFAEVDSQRHTAKECPSGQRGTMIQETFVVAWKRQVEFGVQPGVPLLNVRTRFHVGANLTTEATKQYVCIVDCCCKEKNKPNNTITCQKSWSWIAHNWLVQRWAFDHDGWPNGDAPEPREPDVIRPG